METVFKPTEHPHRRWNPLKEEWILVSPHRLQRPWVGQQEKVQSSVLPVPDPKNPLCPGATRTNGMVTPNYTGIHVFTNDFPALKPDSPKPNESEDPLFKNGDANGTCRVICYTPKTDTTMALMTLEEIINVVKVWIDETKELGSKYDWVQVFENKGEVMGCSNPHPHGQIWASSFVPQEGFVKDRTQKEYFKKYGTRMLLDYERIVLENDEWVVIVPYWAAWPFETIIIPKNHIKRIYDMNEKQINDLADIVLKLCIKYDNVFQTVFPFSMGWHGAPTGSKNNENMEHWVFHGAYYPPLLRSATIKKFMVGYEMFAQPQRDMTPEQAAKILRELPDKHFLCNNC